MKTLPQAVYDARPFTATDTHAVIGKWVEERIAQAIKAERQTVAEIIMNAAHYEENDDIYCALLNLAQDLIGESND